MASIELYFLEKLYDITIFFSKRRVFSRLVTLVIIIIIMFICSTWLSDYLLIRKISHCMREIPPPPPKAGQSNLTWGEGGGGGVLNGNVISVPFLGNLIVEKFQINTQYQGLY